ncbi:MAG: hypothetical protein ACREAI_03195 [Nitrososphaera sp.]
METLPNKRKQAKGIDLGTRKVSVMNFSKVVTLPKPFTDNWLDENMTVQMSMSPDGRLVLTPVHGTVAKKEVSK